ncbi:MAG TPA: hypothetical protein VHR16_02360 [Candidatus Limnocylindrales bacterium]|nr:hypothetical protein [Candidatus Limnocylindrales bacterium]
MATTARPAVLAALFVALLTAACGAGGFLNVGSSSVPVIQPRPEPTDRLHRQAQDALDRWAQAVKDNGGSTITFTGALTSQIGDWEAAVATKDKAALAGGALIASTPLSGDAPGKQQVRWTDGPTVDSEVLSPAQALDDLIADVAHPCASCTPLEITDAKLATSLAQTSTGPAEVPTWVFTIKGTAVRVTRVAVDRSVTVTPGPWNVDDPPAGLSIYAARGTPDSRTIEVQFIGANKACGDVDSAEALESDQAVVVIVDEQLGEAGCTADGAPHTATVSLSAPLGDRVVLEGRQGLPVPVEPAE